MGVPFVSIGLPVFNGEKYLESALDSLLSQDYPNFELIISDNASTDRTAQICARYAERDTRIRYYRNASNLGAEENFNHVFRLSRGDYFMWAAHDDLWHTTYVTRCLEGLMEDRNIVLCASTVQFIDEFGLAVPEHVPGVEPHILDPMRTWRSKGEFAETAGRLVQMFRDNFQAYAGGVTADVRDAGPRVG